MRFAALREGRAPLEVTLNLPGAHNVLNALAAIAVGMELGVADRAILKALAEFRINAERDLLSRMFANRSQHFPIALVAFLALHPFRPATDLDLERAVAQAQSHVDLCLESIQWLTGVLGQ